jgi:16S rRNA (cytosine967-C5)-methyltransferase
LAQFEPSRLIACDINGQRLEAIAPRLKRAGVRAELRQLGSHGEGVEDLAGQADLVLVDAPCSGSGTWRRRPEEAWRLTEADVKRFAQTQGQVLQNAARLVAPGGWLAYVTCSVLAEENDAVVEAFAERHGAFRPVAIADALDGDLLTVEARAQLAALAEGGHTLQLSPARTGTDGFFVALFERVP